MPASRKRNKGKERKAKKAENARSKVHSIWSSMLASACDHGCTAIPVIGHPVSNFMNDYYMPLILAEDSRIGVGLIASFETHLEVWNDDDYRKLLLDVLIGIGTNMLLFDATSSFKARMRMAELILVLEEYGKTKDINLALVGRDTSSKRSLLVRESSCHGRDVLKFFRKRTSCKCVKRMHLEARKTIPKMAACYYCGVEKERVELSVCSKCMVSDYCSKECQVAHWSDHWEHCDHMFKVYRDHQQRQNQTATMSSSDE